MTVLPATGGSVSVRVISYRVVPLATGLTVPSTHVVDVARAAADVVASPAFSVVRVKQGTRGR